MDKRKQVIEIHPYNPDWPNQFAKEAHLLKPIFTDNLVAIHHIGSTSVPNMTAKPTIDILIEVLDIARVDSCNKQMTESGYEAWGEYGILGRRFFIKGENKRTYHVHVFQAGSLDAARHLYFRDYLKTHPMIAKEYAELKLQLATQFAYNRRAYVKGKQDFVKKHEQKAIKWASGQ